MLCTYQRDIFFFAPWGKQPSKIPEQMKLQLERTLSKTKGHMTPGSVENILHHLIHRYILLFAIEMKIDFEIVSPRAFSELER